MGNNKTTIIVGAVVVILLAVAIFGVGSDIGGWGSGGNK